MVHGLTNTAAISYRLSGVLHVLYFTMNRCLQEVDEDSPGGDHDADTPFEIPRVIPEEVAHMAVHLTEYYQSQRMAYEHVSSCSMDYMYMIVYICRALKRPPCKPVKQRVLRTASS